MSRDREIEVKVLGLDFQNLEEKIKEEGGLFLGEEEQTNYHVDSTRHPVQNGSYLRVRKTAREGEDPKFELTFKRNEENDEVRDNMEYNVSLKEEKTVLELLKQLGYDQVECAKKIRRSYRLGEVRFDFDTWEEKVYPHPYLEVEAPSEEVLYETLDRLEIPRQAVSLLSIRQLQEELKKKEKGYKEKRRAQLESDLAFLLELEKMKNVLRMTKVIGDGRRENDAEHSWHIATFALFLSEYADFDVDVCRVVSMLLVHDLVEIYAGDTFCYDVNANKDKKKREEAAMDKLCAFLDEEKGDWLRSTWEEFDAMETPDSIYAAAMDRLQPLFSNLHYEGGTWVTNDVSYGQVLKRIAPIKKASTEIYDYIHGRILEAVEKGWLKRV